VKELVGSFALGRPVGDPVPYTHSSGPTWSLHTTTGRYLVKAVRGPVGTAMAFERRAAEAGLALPRPVPPATPAPGLPLAAEVEGLGVVRVYEWVDGRPLTPDDDVTGWLGATLARLHRIQPLDAFAAAPEWYGLHPPARWREWLAAGEERGLAWAAVLRRRLDDVAATTAWIGAAVVRSGAAVFTHRDVEPWNVLVTARGPVLVDWDTAGPDSAGLEAGHAAFAFAGLDHRPVDPRAVRRTLDAYRAHGGGPLPADGDLFARRAGIMLGRLVERIRITLGEQDARAFDPAALETTAAERLEALPRFVDALREAR
jgi:Ser/Thr protein kinase RdoA (MazF antagonist)